MIANELEHAIDGSRLTLAAIVDRADSADVSRAQMRARLHYCDRTGERLPPKDTKP